MAIDITAECIIRRPRSVVAAYAADPGNTTTWYPNIESATSDGPLRVGASMEFRARFMGRKMEYTYKVAEFEPEKRLVMRNTAGPFSMETTYAWEDVEDGRATRMSIRNRGGPTGFAGIVSPLMSGAARRGTAKALRQLKGIMEGSQADQR